MSQPDPPALDLTRPIGRVLLSRNYGPLFLGSVISNSGTWFQNIAQVLLIYRLTESTLLVGIVNFAQFAPILVLATTAGRAADRLDRRKLLISMQVVAAGLTGLLSLLSGINAINPGIVIGFAFATGVTTAFTTPTLQAFVPSLVSKADLSSAVALTGVTFNLARALGPVVGVLVVANYGIAWAFFFNSLSYLVLVVALLVVHEKTIEATSSLTSASIKVGFRFLTRDSLMFFPIVVVGVVSITADPVNTLTPAFSTDILGRSDTYAGFLVGAFGTGAVAAAFIVTRWRASLHLVSITLLTQSIGMLGFALSTAEWESMAFLFASGFGYLSSVTIATSLLHLAIEDAYRGRVMAFWSMSFHGVRPIGSLLDGALATAAGLRMAGTALAIPAAMGAVAALILARRPTAPENGPPPTASK